MNIFNPLSYEHHILTSRCINIDPLPKEKFFEKFIQSSQKLHVLALSLFPDFPKCPLIFGLRLAIEGNLHTVKQVVDQDIAEHLNEEHKKIVELFGRVRYDEKYLSSFCRELSRLASNISHISHTHSIEIPHKIPESQDSYKDLPFEFIDFPIDAILALLSQDIRPEAINFWTEKHTLTVKISPIELDYILSKYFGFDLLFEQHIEEIQNVIRILDAPRSYKKNLLDFTEEDYEILKNELAQTYPECSDECFIKEMQNAKEAKQMTGPNKAYKLREIRIRSCLEAQKNLVQYCIEFFFTKITLENYKEKIITFIRKILTDQKLKTEFQTVGLIRQDWAEYNRIWELAEKICAQGDKRISTEQHYRLVTFMKLLVQEILTVSNAEELDTDPIIAIAWYKHQRRNGEWISCVMGQLGMFIENLLSAKKEKDLLRNAQDLYSSLIPKNKNAASDLLFDVEKSKKKQSKFKKNTNPPCPDSLTTNKKSTSSHPISGMSPVGKKEKQGETSFQRLNNIHPLPLLLDLRSRKELLAQEILMHWHYDALRELAQEINHTSLKNISYFVYSSGLNFHYMYENAFKILLRNRDGFSDKHALPTLLEACKMGLQGVFHEINQHISLFQDFRLRSRRITALGEESCFSSLDSSHLPPWSKLLFQAERNPGRTEHINTFSTLLKTGLTNFQEDLRALNIDLLPPISSLSSEKKLLSNETLKDVKILQDFFNGFIVPCDLCQSHLAFYAHHISKSLDRIKLPNHFYQLSSSLFIYGQNLHLFMRDLILFYVEEPQLHKFIRRDQFIFANNLYDFWSTVVGTTPPDEIKELREIFQASRYPGRENPFTTKYGQAYHTIFQSYRYEHLAGYEVLDPQLSHLTVNRQLAYIFTASYQGLQAIKTLSAHHQHDTRYSA
jgi:uncharacterized protein YaaR (DUF327 family)